MGPLTALVRLLRPHQWTKNGLCFAGAFFSGNLHAPALGQALLVALVFCAASSAVYALNDVLDRERDRAHPKKRLTRPVASGHIAPWLACAVALALAALAVGGAGALGRSTLACVTLYLLNGVFYSAALKRVALLDVLSIAIGFIIRLLAGVFAVGVAPTAWIAVCTFFLALLIAIGKRLAELSSAQDAAARPVLAQYSSEHLGRLLSSCANAAVLSYAVFTTTADKNHTLVVTLPIVWYALTHYVHLVTSGAGGEEPDQLVFTDPRLVLSVVAWLALYYAIEARGLVLFL